MTQPWVGNPWMAQNGYTAYLKQRLLKDMIDKAVRDPMRPGPGGFRALPVSRMENVGRAIEENPIGNFLAGGPARLMQRWGLEEKANYLDLLSAALDVPVPAAKVAGTAAAGLGALGTLLSMGVKRKAKGLAKNLPKQMGGFGGVNAMTADLDMLTIAVKAEEQGMAPQRIFDATGWFRGKDGKWRFEFDDSGARLTERAREIVSTQDPNKYAYPAKRAELLEAQGVDAAYPDVADTGTGLFYSSKGPGGMYKGDKSISVTTSGGNAEETKGTFLHELQHGIQDIEGFARGGSPESFDLPEQSLRDALQNVKRSEEIQQIYKQADKAEKAGNVKEAVDLYRQADRWSRVRAYERLAGEVEARNVQTRMDYSPDYRRMLPPWMTEDVPRADQIVRME